MPILRIKIPDDEFDNLKEKLKYVPTNSSPASYNMLDMDYELSIIISNVKRDLKYYKQINYTQVYSGYNFDEILPQLKIGKDGYAKYDIEKVFSGYDYDPKHYEDLRIEDYDNLYDIVCKSNQNFDLLEVKNKLQDLKMSITETEFYENIDEIMFEPWEEEQFNKYLKDTDDNTVEEEVSENNDLEEYENENLQEFKIKNATMIFEINGYI